MVDTDKEDRVERVRRAIDWNQCVDNFAGDEEMVMTLMGNFEELTFNDAMERLCKAVIESDYEQMRHSAYRIKADLAYSCFFVFHHLKITVIDKVT